MSLRRPSRLAIHGASPSVSLIVRTVYVCSVGRRAPPVITTSTASHGTRQIDRHCIGRGLALGDQDLQDAPRDRRIDPHGRVGRIRTGELTPGVGPIDDHRADHRAQIDHLGSHGMLSTQRALEIGQPVDEAIEFGTGLDDRLQAPVTERRVEIVARQQLDLVRERSDEMSQVVADGRDQPAHVVRAGVVACDRGPGFEHVSTLRSVST